ncbi:hypothetical protein GCM10010449_43130 [Streptomyces rectiviolaceus]|uniref:Uncharacterized protein n=1 Tax=Streptomyces rectiviolaceus TaxID=332591 RepID=A0ABP6MLG7_9ACTN
MSNSSGDQPPSVLSSGAATAMIAKSAITTREIRTEVRRPSSRRASRQGPLPAGAVSAAGAGVETEGVAVVAMVAELLNPRSWRGS